MRDWGVGGGGNLGLGILGQGLDLLWRVWGVGGFRGFDYRVFWLLGDFGFRGRVSDFFKIDFGFKGLGLVGFYGFRFEGPYALGSI